MLVKSGLNFFVKRRAIRCINIIAKQRKYTAAF